MQQSADAPSSFLSTHPPLEALHMGVNIDAATGHTASAHLVFADDIAALQGVSLKRQGVQLMRY
jgi:hypothetical protein